MSNPMRFAGDTDVTMLVPGDGSLMASSYEDRQRDRQDAKILYDFIKSGGLGDPNSQQNQDTMKKLLDQISGQGLIRGV